MSTELTVDIFVSVDGWGGSDGLPGYFGYLGAELEQWITAEGMAPQHVIMGRRTYEMLAGLPAEFRDESWERMSKLDIDVYSRTLTEAIWPKTRICGEDLVEETTRLKAESPVPLRTMGSLSIARQLLSAGLVDRLRLMTFPLLAGEAGREPAFANVKAADLELVEHQVFDHRVLLLTYHPTGRDVPRG